MCTESSVRTLEAGNPKPSRFFGNMGESICKTGYEEQASKKAALKRLHLGCTELSGSIPEFLNAGCRDE